MQVVECVNADALVVKTADGVQKKIHFSSLRPPRYCAKRSELACRFFDACNSRQGGGGGGGYSQKIGWDVRPASQNGQNRYPINDQNG